MPDIRDEKWIRDHVDMYTGMVPVPATELVQLIRELAETKKKLADTEIRLSDKLWENG